MKCKYWTEAIKSSSILIQRLYIIHQKLKIRREQSGENFFKQADARSKLKIDTSKFKESQVDAIEKLMIERFKIFEVHW